MPYRVPTQNPRGALPTWLSVATIVALTAIAYSNSLTVPFVFDDLTAIKENPTIRSLWPLSDALTPLRQGGETVEGRPLLNLSFAFNYAMGGLDTTSYHATNIAIHLGAALTLYGLLLRCLSSPLWLSRRHFHAGAIALAAALLWAVHPLQTASVTYLSRRAESMVGLFILLSLYCLARASAGGASDHPRWWSIGAIACCFLGAATKETAAVIPIIALLMDRALFAGSFRRALAARWKIYVGMSASWILLGWLVFEAGDRGGTVGFGTHIEPWRYALAQGHAILLYLKLAIWPYPLIFDYGEQLPSMTAALLVQAALVAAAVAASSWAIWRRPLPGLLAAAFFFLLAPSSSFLPIATQPMAEHRMYLPLAAVLLAFILIVFRYAGRAALPIALAASITGAFATHVRNETYQDTVTLWADTVDKRPESSRARNNLGAELSYRGQVEAALPHFKAAAQIEPESGSALANLGSALLDLGQAPESIPHLKHAASLLPDSFETQFALARAYAQAGRAAEAISPLRAAVALQPDHLSARLQLGELLAASRQLPEATEHFEVAVEHHPHSQAARNNLGNALLMSGQASQAAAQYQAALQIDPNSVQALANLGFAELLQGRAQEAANWFEKALAVDPSYEPARQQLERLRRPVR